MFYVGKPTDMERHKDPEVLREVFRHLEILSVLGYTVLHYNVHAVCILS